MDTMDELLAQMKAEYEQKEQPKPKAGDRSISQPANPSQPLPKTSIDNLLVEVREELEQAEPNHQQTTSRKAKSKSSENNSTVKPSQPSNNQNLIEELRQEYQEKEQAEQNRKQQELLAQKQQQQQKEIRYQQVLQQKAQQWLKQLEPNSDEGLWFEEFAYSYESKLAAAMDYLAALGETRFLG